MNPRLPLHSHDELKCHLIIKQHGDLLCIPQPLHTLKLSVLQPMLSLNYVLSILLAALVLKEEITLLKCTGVLIIIAGVILIAGGDGE